MDRAFSRESSLLSHHYSKTNPHADIVLSWNNICYSAVVKNSTPKSIFVNEYKEKKILHNLTGHAKSGELLAIMGPTGCGKSSILNILSARMTGVAKKDIKLSGEILVNGQERDDESFRKMSAYVLQDDRLYSQLTVFETLMLAAHFYLPLNGSVEEKETLASDVMAELGLNKVRDTIIGGNVIRGVSGGERKRVNIAVQLISNPAVLFLDEPTSGLDSFQAQAVMESMKCLAENGRLVLSVIHQPRSSIFDMFDKLLLLSEGHTMYLGKASEAGRYFSEKGHPCPRFYNPADFFLDILSPDNRTEEADKITGDRILTLSKKWLECQNSECLKSNVSAEEDKKDGLSKPSKNEIDFLTTIKYHWHLFLLLLWRSWVEKSRATHIMGFKLKLNTFFGLVLGGMYAELGNDQSGIRDKTGLLVIIAMNQGFGATTGVLNSFPEEKIIVNRERANGAYSVVSYFIAKFIAELPLNCLPSFVFGCIVYWLGNLKPSGFGVFIGLLGLESIAGVALGLVISALSPNSGFANAIGVPCVVVALIFAGFYINIQSLPTVADLVPYVSYIRWAFEGYCINEFTGETFSCDNGDDDSCIRTGEEVLETLSFENETVGDTVLAQFILLIAFLILAMIILLYNRETYIPLNYEGSRYILVKENTISLKDEEKKNSDVTVENDEKKMNSM